MLIIPAIDLKDGECVRLKQGLMDDATVFNTSPGEQAALWLEQGARRLHVVDLNGAFAGKPKNESAIKEIVKALGDEIPIQLMPAALFRGKSSTGSTPGMARWRSMVGRS